MKDQTDDPGGKPPLQGSTTCRRISKRTSLGTAKSLLCFAYLGKTAHPGAFHRLIPAVMLAVPGCAFPGGR